MAVTRLKGQERRVRRKISTAFGLVEDAFYVLVAGTLAIAGLLLFGHSVFGFINNIGKLSVQDNILQLLDSLLLVFIFTELLYTIRTVINEKVLIAEPFLIVGIVAGIRRLVVVSAEVKDLVGTPEFTDAMLELGVLAGSTILLTVAVFLLRHTTHSEPRPTHEPGEVAFGAEEETK